MRAVNGAGNGAWTTYQDIGMAISYIMYRKQSLNVFLCVVNAQAVHLVVVAVLLKLVLTLTVQHHYQVCYMQLHAQGPWLHSGAP